MRLNKSFVLYMAMLWASILFFGCGSSSVTPSATTSTTTISGSVFANSVGGATVSVKNSGGTLIAGPVATLSNGTYIVDLPTSALSGDLVFESSGGTFVDEATGTLVTAGSLKAYIANGTLSAGGAVHLDPSSAVVCDLVTKHGMSLNTAKAVFANAFGYTPDTSVMPINGPSSGTDKSKSLAGLHAMVFSQLTMNLGLGAVKQFDLINGVASDLADGVLDGKQSGVPVIIANGVVMPEDMQNMFECALTSLLSNTSANQTGITSDQIGGGLPMSTVALTNTYKIEYIPGMMNAAVGKSQFKVRITNRSDGSPATGLSVSLMPLMHMSTKNHSAPVDAVAEDGANPGTYKCTAYYLMASGPSMGFWDLKVMVGGMMGESATFYPKVGMSMGTNTVKATLKGQLDTIAGMMVNSPDKRSYYLFSDGTVTATSFKVFVAAKESMMKYPAVSSGTVLHDASNAAWTVNPIEVYASTDAAAWTAMTDNTGGHWSVTGLSGLTTGTAGSIYIKVVVNTEQKTTDGNTVSTTNGYATFNVTP